MNRHEKGLQRLVRSFLEKKESFWGFHEGFLDRWTRLPPDAMPERAREEWNEIYSLVLTSIPDPVSLEDGARGVIGETELRNRLARHVLLATPR